jgi:hypothetical protein
MTSSQITHSLTQAFSLVFLHPFDKAIILLSCWRNKTLIKINRKVRIYGVCACALAHSKFDHSRHRRITLLFIIRILNSKYLNDDDVEGERGSKHSHMHTGETPSAFFKQHQHKERERDVR